MIMQHVITTGAVFNAVSDHVLSRVSNWLGFRGVEGRGVAVVPVRVGPSAGALAVRLVQPVRVYALVEVPRLHELGPDEVSAPRTVRRGMANRDWMPDSVFDGRDLQE